MISLGLLLINVIEFYKWVLIATIIMSWLITFDVINLRNRFVYTIYDISQRLTEPVLKPIRRLMPNLGGLDLSPLILYFGLWFLQLLIQEYWLRAFG